MNITSKRIGKRFGKYIVVIIILFTFFIVKECKKNRLKEKHLFTTGKIISFNTVPPGAYGTRYIYKVNGVEYTSTIDEKYYYKLKGNEFPVIYLLDDEGFSRMLVAPDDFKEFGYEYPDSLKWSLKYLEK